MKRREFIASIGGAALAPLAARAQQATMPVIGYLRSSSIEMAPHMIAGFREGLKEAGFIEGQNVAIDLRSADGHFDRLQGLAADFVRRPVAVIVANGSAAKVVKAATKIVPIIFVFGGDPIKEGLVTSINRPEGNVTGVTFLNASIGAKRLELLLELVPGTTVIGAMSDPSNIAFENELRDVQAAARERGRELVVAQPATEREIDESFAMFVQRRVGALFASGGPFLTFQRARIIALAARHAIPAIYSTRQFVEAGGLVSYGTDQADGYRQAGLYAARILKGATPADLPVMQGLRFELVINLKTAKTLGLSVPQNLQVAADDVIE
jgi:putative ABC transport system substrate-binding protein